MKRTSTAFPNNLKPKIINVFVNGQNQLYKCEINPKLTKTWSEVLIQLGFNISPQFGSVKKLIALSSLQPVRAIHELDSREKYIVLHEGEKFRRAPNGYKTPSEEEDTKKSGSSSLIKRKEVTADLRPRKITKESQPVLTSRQAVKKEVVSGGNMKAGCINTPEKKQGARESSRDGRVPCKHLNSTNQRVNVNQKIVLQHGQKNGVSQPQFTVVVEEINKEEIKDEGKVDQEHFHDAVDKNRPQNVVHTCLSPIRPPFSEKIHSTTSPMHKIVELKNRSVDKISILQKTIETNYNHIENIRSNMSSQSFRKDSKQKNIFQPSPTESIKNITLLSRSSNTQKPKTAIVTANPVVISTNKVPQAVPPIQKLVIPHGDLSSRMRDLKDTILAYRRDISEINQKISAENEKCKNNDWMKDYLFEENQGKPDILKKQKPLVTSASVETL